MFFPGQTGKGYLNKLHRTGPAYLQLLAPRAFPSLSPLSAVLSGHLVKICSETVKAGSEDTEDHGTRLHSLTELSRYICHFFPVRQPLGVQEGRLGSRKGSPWNLYPPTPISPVLAP